ncbi:MAG: nonstructural protein [Microviridae sp.]|nr:MAG: nonstructural protein [Microviridae sp.]
MRVLLFSILDTVAGVFMSPFVARSEVDAIRQIAASKSDPNIASTPVGTNPRDFVLYELGFLDDETGQIFPVFPPRRVSPVADIWGGDAP